MKKRHYLFIIFNLALILSCNNTDLCDNELPIFKVDDSIPTIKIKDTDTRDSIINRFQSKFGEELCFKDLEFGLQTPDKLVKMYFKLYCALKTSRTPIPYEIRIHINQEKKILVNAETIIDIENIGDWITKDLKVINDKNKYKRAFTIQWNSFTSSENLELVVLELEKAFRSRFNNISVDLFDKSYCNLNEEQTSKVLEAFPYKIVLDLGYPPPPPPPPSN